MTFKFERKFWLFKNS